MSNCEMNAVKKAMESSLKKGVTIVFAICKEKKPDLHGEIFCLSKNFKK